MVLEGTGVGASVKNKEKVGIGQRVVPGGFCINRAQKCDGMTGCAAHFCVLTSG